MVEGAKLCDKFWDPPSRASHVARYARHCLVDDAVMIPY